MPTRPIISADMAHFSPVTHSFMHAAFLGNLVCARHCTLGWELEGLRHGPFCSRHSHGLGTKKLCKHRVTLRSETRCLSGRPTKSTECPGNMLLLLSCFSRVRPCATLWTAAHQAPPYTGFSRQEYWSGLPFPSPPGNMRRVQIIKN